MIGLTPRTLSSLRIQFASQVIFASQTLPARRCQPDVARQTLPGRKSLAGRALFVGTALSWICAGRRQAARSGRASCAPIHSSSVPAPGCKVSGGDGSGRFPAALCSGPERHRARVQAWRRGGVGDVGVGVGVRQPPPKATTVTARKRPEHAPFARPACTTPASHSTSPSECAPRTSPTWPVYA